MTNSCLLGDMPPDGANGDKNWETPEKSSCPPWPRCARPSPPATRRPCVKASRLTHLIFERPDLERAVRFLTDFGLRMVRQDAGSVYLRGAARRRIATVSTAPLRPASSALGWRCRRVPIWKASARLPGACATPRSSAPGGRRGGGCCTIRPDFGVEAIFGQSEAAPFPFLLRAPLALNAPLPQPGARERHAAFARHSGGNRQAWPHRSGGRQLPGDRRFLHKRFGFIPRMFRCCRMVRPWSPSCG